MGTGSRLDEMYRRPLSFNSPKSANGSLKAPRRLAEARGKNRFMVLFLAKMERADLAELARLN